MTTTVNRDIALGLPGQHLIVFAPARRPIRVLVAEDEQPRRDALAALIDDGPDLELAGVATDADDVWWQLSSFSQA